MKQRFWAAALVFLGAPAAFAQQSPPPAAVAVSSFPSASYGALSAAVDRVMSGKGGVMAVATPEEDPNKPCLIKPGPATVRIDARRLEDPKPDHTAFEKGAFWTTWGTYQLAGLGDLATTANLLNLSHTGESDPLYTAFGKSNKLGVLGSVTVIHIAASVASWAAYDWAKETTGWKRVVLDTLGIGINTVGTAAHAEGTVHNIQYINGRNGR